MDLIWKVGARAKEILVLKEEGKKDEGSKGSDSSVPVSETENPPSSDVGKQERQEEPEEPVSEQADAHSDKSSTPEYDEKEPANLPESTTEQPAEAAAPAPTPAQAPGKTEMKEVSFKAVEQARSFGSYLFNVANRTSRSLSETAKQLKSTVEQNIIAGKVAFHWNNMESILGDFNKEQETFMNNKVSKSSDAGLPPWVGCEDEENVKQQILSLSSDKRNFLRSPPSGVLFEFNFDAMHPVATVMLKEDPSLEKMRFDLVPKLVSEENFWRNYFYRVSLLKQSTRLSSMSHQKNTSSDSTAWPAKKNSSDENTKEPNSLSSKIDLGETDVVDSSNQEFVSDDFQSSHISEEDIKHGMKLLGVTEKGTKEEDWEKELQQELQEYEVVPGENTEDDPAWENEIDQILGSEKIKDIV